MLVYTYTLLNNFTFLSVTFGEIFNTDRLMYVQIYTHHC